MMSDIEGLHPQPGQDPSLVDPGYSQRLLAGVAATAEQLYASNPRILGVTGFGSMVRGQAHEGSDADICVIIDPDTDQFKDLFVGDESSAQEGTVLFDPFTQYATREEVKQALAYNGINDSDVWVVPMHEKVIDANIDLISTALRQGRDLGGTEARNVRALFHASVKDFGLSSFQAQTFDSINQRFSDGHERDEAWRLVRRGVIDFEAGRNNADSDVSDHRYIPATFSEAKEFYTNHEFPG